MTVKERTALISLVASMSLAAAKLVIGLMIGSLALITDALHSGVDFLATAITWVAVRFGDRPPDESHPYGHGKFENIAALAAATLLLLLAGGVAVESFGRLRSGGSVPEITILAVGVLVVEIGINAWRAYELRRVGRETGSAALEADSLHFASDVFSSFAVLGGFALIAAGYTWGDSVAALAVAALIAVLALRLVKRTIDELVDRAPPGVARMLEDRLLDLAGILGVESVRIRSVGPQYFVEAVVQVPRSVGIEQAAETKRRATESVRSLLPNAEVALQSVPVSPSDETIHDRVLLVGMREKVGIHHVTVHHLGDRLALGVDLEVPGKMPLAAAHAVADRLEAAIRDEFGQDTEIEIHIEPLEPEALDVEERSDATRQRYRRMLEDAAAGIEGISDVHDVRIRRSDRGTVLVAHCRFDPAETVENVHARVDALERRVREHDPEIARILIHAEPRKDVVVSSR